MQKSRRQSELMLFESGQIFGEERHLMQHLMKSQKLLVLSPYTIKCTTTQGQLFKISAVEFVKKILRD
jgi:hypothetical protein